jgi:hypothetical protein
MYLAQYIACKFKCYISKSKLVLSECNDRYLLAIAFIAFTLHEIRPCLVLFSLGHPVEDPSTLNLWGEIPKISSRAYKSIKSFQEITRANS